jgi:hypothetical protein
MAVESSSEDQIPVNDAEAHKAHGGQASFVYISDGMRGQVKDFCRWDVFSKCGPTDSVAPGLSPSCTFWHLCMTLNRETAAGNVTVHSFRIHL